MGSCCQCILCHHSLPTALLQTMERVDKPESVFQSSGFSYETCTILKCWVLGQRCLWVTLTQAASSPWQSIQVGLSTYNFSSNANVLFWHAHATAQQLRLSSAFEKVESCRLLSLSMAMPRARNGSFHYQGSLPSRRSNQPGCPWPGNQMYIQADWQCQLFASRRGIARAACQDE